MHADLNLKNLLMTEATPRQVPPEIHIIDLDKARSGCELSVAERRANLRRLVRSLRKLDPGKRLVSTTGLTALLEGYGSQLVIDDPWELEPDR